MSYHERPHSQPEYASPDDLHRVFEDYAAALPTTIRTHDPKTREEIITQASPVELSPHDLLEPIRYATDTPFVAIDSIVASHLPADFDISGRNDGTTYPEIVAITMHGYYGESPMAERSISYVIAKDADTHQLTGFALQHFHDADSYMFAAPDNDPRWSVYLQPTEFLRTIAADLNKYKAFISDTITDISVDASEIKRTTELRQLDVNDLVLFDSALYESVAPTPTLSTEL